MPCAAGPGEIASAAVSSVLVEPEGLSALDDTPRVPETGRRPWIAAAVVGALAAVALALGETGGVDLSSHSERSVIEAHLDAWYGGDYDAASALRAPERIRTGPSEERARGEVEYQAALEADTELLRCEPLPPSTLRCDVSYSNLLNEAVGKPAAIVAQQFGMEDGRILFVAGPYLEDDLLTDSFRRFAELLFPQDYDASCNEEPSYQPRECADFKLAHLEDWSSWHQIEFG